MIYEQPLNEHIRICLRLESLFERVAAHLMGEESWQSAFALNSLLELLAVIERPDLKSKLVKALSYTAKHALDSADGETVSAAAQLQHFLNALHNYRGKFGRSLYENTFLKSLRCQLATPGGACLFNAPDYYLWLQQPSEQRAEDIRAWLAPFSELQAIVALLLSVTRKRSELSPVLAAQGFYQQALDTRKAGQMIRILLDDNLGLYPVFSVGRHRFAVHFYKAHFREAGEPEKWKDDVAFDLAYCAL